MSHTPSSGNTSTGAATGVGLACPKCGHVREASDRAPSGHCPRCGIVYVKYRPDSLLMPVTEPIRASGPRPTSFPFAALLALVLVLATGGYFMRDRLLAKPEPVLQAQKMSLLMKRETGQGLPAYTVALENERAVARLLPDAKKNLSQFAAEPVVLFSTSWCSYCAEARRVLNAAEVRYKEVDVERDADAMRYHSKVLRAEGVPVIIVGNRVLIGYNETELMLASLGAPK